MKILIVGGVAGGASVAARARRLNEDADIIIFERGPHISFANCGLPYHISGDIKSREKLLLQTPESFYKRFNVDVRVNNEVIAIDRSNKQISVANLATGERYQESYDFLLLSPGAKPIMPPINDLDNPLTYSLRNIPDMDAILSTLDKNKVTHATVCGGGFIGLEMVEALVARNINTTLVEFADQVMTPVDKEMAVPLHQEIKSNGVDLKLSTALQAVAYNEAQKQLTLSLSDDSQLCTDLLIMSVGVRPDVDFIKAAGIEVGELGGIKVNRQMKTNDPFIFAVGDAVEDFDFLTRKPVLVPLAGPANRQGRLAAGNMLGREDRYNNTQGTAICKVFEQAVACTGLNEKRLVAEKIEFKKVYLHAVDHAGYYPGAEMISLKVLFAPDDGKILGAQAAGKSGIDKRIDLISVAIRAGMTVYDLQDFELCYAPPFGAAKDILNQAGFVASNWLKGDTNLCYPEQLDKLEDDQVVLDVRTAKELETIGAINGAINIPVDELRHRHLELNKSKEILITCQVGIRANVAFNLLNNLGYKVKNVSGGYRTYSAFNQ